MSNLWDKLGELGDDIQDFYEITRDEGLDIAIGLTKDKLFGADIPNFEPKQFNEEGFSSNEANSFDYTSKINTDDPNNSYFEYRTKAIDPNKFIFTGGRQDINFDPIQDFRRLGESLGIVDDETAWYSAWEEDLVDLLEYRPDLDLGIDVTFPGAPGEKQGFSYAKKVDWGDEYWNKLSNEDDREWLTAGEEGGLYMSDDSSKFALSHLKEIFNLEEFKDQVKDTGFNERHKPLDKHTVKRMHRLLGTPSKIEGTEYPADLPFPDLNYNLALVKDNEVKRITQLMNIRDENLAITNLEDVLELLEFYDANRVFHLDAGRNFDWGFSEDMENRFYKKPRTYTGTGTIAGERIE
tara:strand:+ start:411 stop:1466 length:1056 start_codon:yes stop_codon:yes gene_type:complete